MPTLFKLDVGFFIIHFSFFCFLLFDQKQCLKLLCMVYEPTVLTLLFKSFVTYICPENFCFHTIVFNLHMSDTQRHVTCCFNFPPMADTSWNFRGGGATARGLIRFICQSHGRGIQGHTSQENFEIYNHWNALSSILRDRILQNFKGCEVCGRIDFLLDYFHS